MTSVRSEKIQLSCRVSSETYNKVKALVESNNGEKPLFGSIAEYLQSLIYADLAKRESNARDIPLNSITMFLEELEERVAKLEKGEGGKIISITRREQQD
jgi:hypothetical protein